MADEGDDWFGGGDDDAPPAPVKSLIKKKGDEPAPAAAEAPPAGEEAPTADGEAVEEKPEDDEEYLDPDKLILFKHWIRPKFLPYKYLHIYRQNYYDDVMDYLDKRAKGICREIPRAQTWAERILRTFSNKVTQHVVYSQRIKNDLEFTEKTKTSGSFYYYHVKNAFNKKFSPLLF